MLDEPFADRAARAHDHVEHTRGDARLQREALQLERCQGRQRRGLEDDRVARRERRAELPRRDRDGEVPRHDEPDHAERLAEGHVDAAGDRDRVAQQPLRRTRVVVEDVDDHADLAARVADRLTHVARLDLGELLGAVRHGVGESPEQRAAVVRRDRAPGGEGRLGPGDRPVCVLDRGFGDLGQHFLGRGLDHFHGGPKDSRDSKLTPESKPVLRLALDDATYG